MASEVINTRFQDGNVLHASELNKLIEEINELIGEKNNLNSRCGQNANNISKNTNDIKNLKSINNFNNLTALSFGDSIGVATRSQKIAKSESTNYVLAKDGSYGFGYLNSLNFKKVYRWERTRATWTRISGTSDYEVSIISQIEDWIEKCEDNNNTEIIKDVDIVFFEGGINDYNQGRALGNVPTTPFSDISNYNDETLGQALCHGFSLICNKLPEAQKYFIITHKAYCWDRYCPTTQWTTTASTNNKYTQQQLHDQIVKCCKLFNIHIIDVYENSHFDTGFEYFKNIQTENYYFPYIDEGVATTWHGPKQAFFEYDYEAFKNTEKYSDDFRSARNNFLKTQTEVWNDSDGLHPMTKGYEQFYVPLIKSKIIETYPFHFSA